MLKRLVSNRFLRVDVLGRRPGRTLVAIVDEASDPQTDVGELLVSMGYALAEPKAPPPASSPQGKPQPKSGAGLGAIPKTPGRSTAPTPGLLEVIC